jgi:hypothetical protein
VYHLTKTFRRFLKKEKKGQEIIVFSWPFLLIIGEVKMVKIKPHHVHLICNAKYHDTDFARSELVNLFSEHDDLGVSISQDYSDFYKFKDSDLLITYTCDLSPAQEGSRYT